MNYSKHIQKSGGSRKQLQGFIRALKLYKIPLLGVVFNNIESELLRKESKKYAFSYDERFGLRHLPRQDVSENKFVIDAVFSPYFLAVRSRALSAFSSFSLYRS
jgi:hypothetical protein